MRVDRELVADLKRVSGKNGLLFQIAEASLDRPEHTVRDVVYPIASEATLENLVREFKATGPAYRRQLHTVMSTAYRSHYRAMLIRLLNTLQFRSNNATHRPVLDALAIVKKYASSRMHAYATSLQKLIRLYRHKESDYKNWIFPTNFPPNPPNTKKKSQAS